MVTSMKSIQFVLLIILTLFIVSSDARLVPQFSTIGKRVSNKLGLSEFINNVRNSREWLSKRSMLGGRLDRVSPAGPDGQHH
ncbi:hypothetical protein Lal_00028692 [Lupinus albus]|uniref:Uncharacterized protein n=1 Tax=Lupinus albus TaxID=3870 RepID=A0A6A5NSF9_LUPAL|nr:hypothetical protein Lalb_Chr19g0133921 [Lupinus albus]KAF1884805.1 hypothetical protein Lal_00028692 [Lupinus albus]